MEARKLEPQSGFRIVRRGAFRVAGISAAYAFGGAPEIGDQWTRFMVRLGEIAGRIGGNVYGVCDGMFGDEDRYTYLAACEVSGTAKLPAGFVSQEIPAHSYAVFEHTGHVSGISQTMQTVCRRALPEAGLERIGAPDLLEVYDERFDPNTGSGVIELWLPVKEQ